MLDVCVLIVGMIVIITYLVSHAEIRQLFDRTTVVPQAER